VPLRVSSADTLIDSLLVTGFPYSVQQDPTALVGLFGEFLKHARAVRRLGSAALDLCYVGAGRFDGFWEQKLHPWDVAAGALIVHEAGGHVTDGIGAPFRSRAGSVIATNGRIHEAMVNTIRTFSERFRSRNWTE
jgi:myo-inositol-1(or 4)-monophosphatase